MAKNARAPHRAEFGSNNQTFSVMNVKVVFAIDAMGQISEIGDMLQLAIVSCQRNTSLQPVVMATCFVQDYRDWLEKRGVKCFVVETPMASTIVRANQETGYPLQAIGNYLRYELCSIIDDDVVLYVDCDVIFLRDPIILTKPVLFAAGPEDTIDDYERMNSGVLVVNVPALRKEIAGFYEFARHNLARLYPGFDQPAINEYFKGRIEHLPVELNWRPYWGPRQNAAIVHFHGAKAEAAQQLLDGIYHGREDRKGLTLDIISRTLENLPFFLRQLWDGDWDALSYVEALQRLAKRVEVIKRDPVGSYCRSAVHLRDEITRQAFDARRQIHRMAAQTLGVAGLRCSVIGINHAIQVRMVIHQFQDLLGFGNLEDLDGNVIARFEGATTKNILIFEKITIGSKELIAIAINEGASYIDIIFNVPCVVPGTQRELRVWLWALAKVNIITYLSSGDGFSERWVFHSETT